MWLLGYFGWLLGCCYAVARVPGWLLGPLLGYPGWLLRCCYAVARVPRMVAKVLLGYLWWLLWYHGGLLLCC